MQINTPRVSLSSHLIESVQMLEIVWCPLSILFHYSLQTAVMSSPIIRLTSNIWAGYSSRLLRAGYSPATRRPIFRTKTLLSLTDGEVVKT